MNQGMSANTTLSHYRILSKIGAGGMGEVYLAQDTKLDRKVAIKFLHEEFQQGRGQVGPLYPGSQGSFGAESPEHSDAFMEIGEVDGKNYISTELIDGQTLRAHLSQKESLQLNQILKIGDAGIGSPPAAHQVGIVHRDIKPENIMLRKDGYAKVLRFRFGENCQNRKR